jgi:diacylglycerol kinase (ATP)
MEKNAKIHAVFAILAIVLGFALHIAISAFLLVFFAIVLVIFAEAVNTAIERTIDLVETESSQMVRLVKDISAGAVLIAAIAAIFLGIAVFGGRILQLIGVIH